MALSHVDYVQWDVFDVMKLNGCAEKCGGNSSLATTS